MCDLVKIGMTYNLYAGVSWVRSSAYVPAGRERWTVLDVRVAYGLPGVTTPLDTIANLTLYL